jgi:hypothetical protein
MAEGEGDSTGNLARRNREFGRFQAELQRLAQQPHPRLSALFALLHDLDELVASRHRNSPAISQGFPHVL